MTKRLNRDEAERMMPLLRAIGREIRERTKAVAALESVLQERLTVPQLSIPQLNSHALDAGSHDAFVDATQVGETNAISDTTLQSLLSTHRRELRRCERELNELGCGIDADHPLRILIPATDGGMAYEGKLDGTQFYRKRLDVKS